MRWQTPKQTRRTSKICTIEHAITEEVMARVSRRVRPVRRPVQAEKAPKTRCSPVEGGLNGVHRGKPWMVCRWPSADRCPSFVRDGVRLGEVHVRPGEVLRKGRQTEKRAFGALGTTMR